MTLHLLRHMARRAHQDAVARKAPDAELYATAHEEICELLGKSDLLLTICNFLEDSGGNASEMRCAGIIGSAIGVPHSLILNFKAANPGWVEPQGSGDNGSVVKGAETVCGLERTDGTDAVSNAR